METEIPFRIAFWALIGLMFAIRTYFAALVRRSGERLGADTQAIRREGRGVYALRWALFILLIIGLVVYAIYPAWLDNLLLPLSGWLRWLGAAFGLASLALLAWSQIALGRLWSAQLQLRPEHHLVTGGPYARMRHPLYSALFGYGIGLALVTASWIFILLAVIIIAGMSLRVGKEEQMMIDQFGDEYRAYMRRTWRYFPRIFFVQTR